MPKKNTPHIDSVQSLCIIDAICRTQGVGRLLAKSIANKLADDQKAQIIELASGKNSGSEILRILGDSPKQEPNPEHAND